LGLQLLEQPLEKLSGIWCILTLDPGARHNPPPAVQVIERMDLALDSKTIDSFFIAAS
jgi:hypothetical protein